MASQVITAGSLQNIIGGAMKAGGSNTNMDEVAISQSINFPGGLTVTNNFNFITGTAAGAVDDVQKLIDIPLANRITKDSILDKTSDRMTGNATPIADGRDMVILSDWTEVFITTGESAVPLAYNTIDEETYTYGADSAVNVGPGYLYKMGRNNASGVI